MTTSLDNLWTIDGQRFALDASVTTQAEADAWYAANTANGPPPPQPSDVYAERDRRLSLGFDYDFEDERGVHRIGTTDADMRSWNEVTTAFNAADKLGHPLQLQIMTDTGPAQVNSAEWAAILLRSAQVRQDIWKASFVLQSADPIPEDFADDQYWTAPE